MCYRAHPVVFLKDGFKIVISVYLMLHCDVFPKFGSSDWRSGLIKGSKYQE